MDYDSIIRIYNLYQARQQEKYQIPTDLNEWKNRAPDLNLDQLFDNASTRKKRSLDEFYSNDGLKIVELPSEYSSTHEIQKRDTTTPTTTTTVATTANTGLSTLQNKINIVEEPEHQEFFPVDIPEPNCTLVAIKAIFRKIGFLLVPGLLFFILLNDTHISLVKKLMTFGAFFVYAVVVVVSDGISRAWPRSQAYTTNSYTP